MLLFAVGGLNVLAVRRGEVAQPGFVKIWFSFSQGGGPTSSFCCCEAEWFAAAVSREIKKRADVEVTLVTAKQSSSTDCGTPVL